MGRQMRDVWGESGTMARSVRRSRRPQKDLRGVASVACRLLACLLCRLPALAIKWLEREEMTQASSDPVGRSEVSPLDGRVSRRDGAEAAVLEVSVVMPCLNEADTVETCIRKARHALQDHGIAVRSLLPTTEARTGPPRSRSKRAPVSFT
jgi:hypothetical protein